MDSLWVDCCVFLDRFAAFDREAEGPGGFRVLGMGLHTGPIESE